MPNYSENRNNNGGGQNPPQVTGAEAFMVIVGVAMLGIYKKMDAIKYFYIQNAEYFWMGGIIFTALLIKFGLWRRRKNKRKQKRERRF